MTTSVSLPRLPGAAFAAVAAWLGLAIIAGATGFLARLPFPGPQLIILTLLVATVAAGTPRPPLRARIDALPPRPPIRLHPLRLLRITVLARPPPRPLPPVLA